jgi:predicted lipid-binding transport protein (Tim44 family)
MVEQKQKDNKAAAAKPKPGEKPARKKRVAGLVLKGMLVLLVLVMLAGGALATAVYFRFVDLDAVAAEYKLHELPVVGRYLAKPTAVGFAPVELPPEEAAKGKPAAPAAVQAAQAAPPPAATAEDVKALAAKARQEEAKRISRLARLYGEMKPDEAVPIINQLDDPTVLAIFGKMEDSQVAKIMAQLDARRAARLSQSMLKGKTM